MLEPWGLAGCDKFTWLSEGESDRGVEIAETSLEPKEATAEGEAGGSGDRVKYTTLASDPPTCKGISNVFREILKISQLTSTAMCDTGSM